MRYSVKHLEINFFSQLYFSEIQISVWKILKIGYIIKNKKILDKIMERISTKKLPPIFKMSVLWDILPYYGHLHRWRRLLEKINTETKEIWDQNREQLMHIGRDFKREIELDHLKGNASNLRPNRSWLDLFSLSLSNLF